MNMDKSRRTNLRTSSSGECIIDGSNFIQFSEGNGQNNSVSRIAHYEDVCRRTVEVLQHASIFKADCCLEIHNADLKFVWPISR